jgi:hypothetical protein
MASKATVAAEATATANNTASPSDGHSNRHSTGHSDGNNKGGEHNWKEFASAAKMIRVGVEGEVSNRVATADKLDGRFNKWADLGQ